MNDRIVQHERKPDWVERNHRPYPTDKQPNTFSRTLEEHLADTGPRLEKIRFRDILSPEVEADGSQQVLSALAFRRRWMPLAVAAFVVVAGAIWFLSPNNQHSSSPTTTLSVNP